MTATFLSLIMLVSFIIPRFSGGAPINVDPVRCLRRQMTGFAIGSR